MSNCSCIKGVYNYYINVIDSKTLIYNDLSTWMEDETYIIPEKHNVLLELPNSHIIKFEANVQNSTILKAEDLNLLKFKDGIYKLSIEPLDESSGGCGMSYYKKVGIFPKIRCCIDKAYSTLDDKFFDKIKDAEMFLEFAENESEFGNIKKSIDYWNTSKKILEKINCNCSESC